MLTLPDSSKSTKPRITAGDAEVPILRLETLPVAPLWIYATVALPRAVLCLCSFS